MNFAAFIMTFRRPETLRDTIKALREQTLPPAHILIVDNDPEESARPVAGHASCDYHAVGYNSGPAGAAYWGLKLLFEAGWEWVLWVDDDDPPAYPDLIYDIISVLNEIPDIEKVGVIGAVGANFTPWLAMLKRITDKKLLRPLKVNSIAGGQFPIIHRRVYESGILPDPNLFFGFEELEFCRRVSKAGFQLWISGIVMLRLRQLFGRLNLSTYHILSVRNSPDILRSYYSTRNMAYLLLYKERNIVGLVLLSIRIILRILRAISTNRSFAYVDAKVQSYALYHGLTRKLGVERIPE